MILLIFYDLAILFSAHNQMNKCVVVILLCLLSSNSLTAQLQKLQTVVQDKTSQYSVSLSQEVVYFQRNIQPGNPFDGSIWVTDGSAQGTKKIVDNLQLQYSFVKKGDSVFYFTTDNLANLNLCSYSTTSGAQTIKTLPQFASPSSLVAVNGYLYFYAGGLLWKSTGTVQGTISFSNNLSLSTSDGLSSIIPFENKLLVFIIRNLYSQSPTYEWWNVDPVSGNGTLIYSSSINQYGYPSSPSLTNSDFAVLNNIIYFSGYDDAHGLELWRSDGTQAGTYLFADIDPRIYNDSFVTNLAFKTSPHHFFIFNGLVYFSIYKNQSNPYDNSVEELWATNGTPGGVIQIQSSLSQFGSFSNANVVNGDFLLTYDDTIHGNELWISDGSSSGTRMLQDLWIGPAPAFQYNDSFLNTSSEVYFSADDGKIGNELWKFDPIKKSIELVSDILPGPVSSYPVGFQKLNNSLTFLANDASGNKYFYSLELTKIQPTSVIASPFLPANQWFQTIGNDVNASGDQPFYYNYDMDIDSKNNIYLSGQFNQDKTIFYENSFIANLPAYYRNIAQVSKFSSNGLLQWQKILNPSNSYTEFYNGPMLAATNDASVVVANSFYSSISFPWINYLGLPELAYPGIYITKLDGTGNILWAKYALTLSYQPYVHSVKADQDNNTYVAGLYFGGMYWNDTLLLSYKYSPNYFLLKLDPKGNLVWAKNLITDWSDYGKIADIKIDSKNKKIFMLITEGTRNEQSTCAYQSWHLDFFSIDFNGNYIRDKQVESSDLMVASSFDFNSIGDFYITGRYRGKLIADKSSITSPSLGGCSVTQGFVLQLDSAMNTQSLSAGMTEVGDPYELKFLKDGSYVLSGSIIDADYSSLSSFGTTLSVEKIFINQYDPFNNLLSHRVFDKNPNGTATNVDFTNFNSILRFDNENNFVLSDRYINGFDTVANALAGEIGTMKTFLMRAPLNYLAPVSINDPANYPIEFFPNPANERLNIKLWNQSTFDFSIQIIDALGKPLNSAFVNSENEIYYVDVSSYANGLYFFIFDNGKQRITKKVIIAH